MTPDARFHRQLILPEVGEKGQARLRQSSVLVVGLGGLGCPVALYLAGAGVGRLVLMDDQQVELSNLHRQVLYGVADVGRAKAEAARDRLLAIDPGLRVEAVVDTLRADTAGWMEGCDVTVDGTDSFESKFLLSDAAILLRRPAVHGAVLQWSGQVTTVMPAGPCLRCLFRDPPELDAVPGCEQAGIIGPVTGVVGSVQSEEVLKILLGAGEPLSGRMFHHDALSGESRVIQFPRDPDCPSCSTNPRIRSFQDYGLSVLPRGHLRA
jgi:adenylyltransferase/sulfurtransferase